MLFRSTIENGVWRGAVLIVSECACSRMRFRFRFSQIMVSRILTRLLREASDAGSYYDPPPTLRFYYDHTLPPPNFRRSTHIHRAPSRTPPIGRTPSNSFHSLHRSASSNTAPSSPIQDVYGRISEIGPHTQVVAVTGQEIWVYCGNGG